MEITFWISKIPDEFVASLFILEFLIPFLRIFANSLISIGWSETVVCFAAMSSGLRFTVKQWKTYFLITSIAHIRSANC